MNTENFYSKQYVDRESVEYQDWLLPEITGKDLIASKHKIPPKPVTQKTVDEQVQIQCEAGYQQGYQEGLEQGKEKGVQEFTEICEKLKKYLSEITTQWQDITPRLNEWMLSLVVLIAEAVIKKELSVQQELLVPLITQSLELLPKNSKEVIISVNPQDLAWIQQELQDNNNNFLSNVTWVADESIISGGVKLNTDFSYVDASVSTRIKDAVDALYLKE